jgi:hypothetical protein
MHTTARYVTLLGPPGKSLAVRLAAVHQPPDRAGIRDIVKMIPWLVRDSHRHAMESWVAFS